MENKHKHKKNTKLINLHRKEDTWYYILKMALNKDNLICNLLKLKISILFESSCTSKIYNFAI